ncbi:hypothetical protein [Streptomyces sp. MI02-7b]|uniref:hypothetical protein n=1 Tax=Streptomyces sp. MI02-7b TaxID=462941 RepID=UPI0029B343E8|nr:hypothetical protein [Streptomyces sp. MI02-7b]MDX3074542.1 hypothetical protein [Streptomyces sp. MI02-7b]
MTMDPIGERADEALRSALMDVPPKGSPDDEAYAAALADVALLRAQLRLIGDTVAARPPSTVAVRRPRRRRTAVLWLAAVAVGVLAVAGLGIARQAALGGGGTSDAKLGPEGVVACARVIAEGAVREVTPTGAPGDLRVVLDVDRSLKPAGGDRRLTFTIHVDDDHDDVAPPPGPGSRVLVLLSTLPGEPVDWYQGQDIAPARSWMEKALTGARGLPCGSGTG